MKINAFLSLFLFFAQTTAAASGEGVEETSQASPSRPFSIDVMVQNEGLAEALFGPKGERLLIEKTAAYENSINFAWPQARDRDRATLLDVTLDDDSQLKTVSPGNKERVWFSSYSPSGDKAAVGWFDGEQAKAGVYDFKTNTLRKFNYLTSMEFFCAYDYCPLWLSEDEYVHYSVSADEQKKIMSRIMYTDDLTSWWARKSWSGQEVAVKILGSGEYQSKEVAEGGKLIKVNVLTGDTTTLGEGLFKELVQSPDRTRLAAIRETGNLDIGDSEIKLILGSDKIFELVVYDFTTGVVESIPCKFCNVTLGSLSWSPESNKLFFAARAQQGGELEHTHYIYDFDQKDLKHFSPEGVDFKTITKLRGGGRFLTPFLWLDNDTPAVRLSREQDDKNGARYDWYALPAGSGPVELTANLQSETPLEDYVAVQDGRLLMMVDGDLWSLSADGSQENLTKDINETLSPWCSVVAYWREISFQPICSGFRQNFYIRPIDEGALTQGWLTFRIMDGIIPNGDVLFLNINTGENVRIEKPHPEAELVTVSALAKAALYRNKAADGDHLMLTSVGGAVQELLHFNRHLDGVVGGTPIMLTRRESGENEDRIDWLLLPPGHQPGDRHPLLVYFYPDREYSKEWRSDDLRNVNFLNQHIPAGKGYVVLLASMKIGPTGEAGEPMTQMHEQLIHAAENAVAEGYADPDRWALMGHSYGGYGTYSVITQTNRFKAAVALSGLVNLTSAYAMGLSGQRVVPLDLGLSYGAMWLEGGQGRMGSAPWQDPERYIRNSPLFHADKIETPVLMIHGDSDLVNVSETEQMFNALHRQGKEAQFLRYWGEGHQLRSPANIKDMWERIFVWLDRYLGPPEPANDNSKTEANLEKLAEEN